MKNTFIEKIFEEAKANNIKNIYIFAHRKHDLDAKCSALALVNFFVNNGYISKYIITSEDYLLTDIFGKVEVTKWAPTEEFIAVCVDSSTRAILENDFCFRAKKIFKIDHHKDGENYADYSLVMDNFSSTCEILSYIILDDCINNKMATILYTGIRSDTGGFSYSTSANTFIEVAKLLNKGADHLLVNRALNSVTLKRKKLEGIVYSHAKFYGKDLLGAILCDCKDYSALSIARSVNGLTNVNAKVFFIIAQEKENVYVEIRSAATCDIDVSFIAKKYGGGGHFHASGFCIKKDNKNFIYNFVDELKKLIL